MHAIDRLMRFIKAAMLGGIVVMAAPVWGAGAASQAEAQPDARAILMQMADYLAALPAFSVKLDARYDVVQATGQKIEFSDDAKIVLQRPDHLRAEYMGSDSRGNLTLFDGKNVSILDRDAGVFAQAPQPGSIDDAIIYFVRDLGMRLPLAPLFTTRLPAEFSRQIHAADYVELTNIDGEATHHLAARGDLVDLQVWVADGVRPLPLRMVLSYISEPGQPQFRVQFSDWNLKPQIDSATFRFEPPKDAEQIVFAVQIPAPDAVPPTGAQP